MCPDSTLCKSLLFLLVYKIKIKHSINKQLPDKPSKQLFHCPSTSPSNLSSQRYRSPHSKVSRKKKTLKNFEVLV